MQYEPTNDPAVDSSRYQLSGTYVKVKIAIDPALYPLVTELKPPVKDLILHENLLFKEESTSQLITEFKNTVVNLMDNMRDQYHLLYQKEKGQGPDSKLKSITVQRKHELQKRRDIFISEFLKDGKFRVLKLKLQKDILKIIKDKFQKSGNVQRNTTGH